MPAPSAGNWELSPSCTHTLTRLVPLHVQIDLPAIPPEHLNLQVGYWSADGRRTGVEAEWGNGHLLMETVLGVSRSSGSPRRPNS